MSKTLVLGLLLVCLVLAVPQVHDVVIIGSGMSALRASQVLQEEGIEHIILEAADHFGGRVTPTNFAGMQIDKGASYIHNSSTGNPLGGLLRALHWPSVNGTMNADALYL